MKRETFVSILSATLAEADEELLREAEGLVFWRRRELRALRVQEFSAGERISFTMPDGTTRDGTIHHLNRYSITVHEAHPTSGYTAIVIPVERVLHKLTTNGIQ